MQLCSTVIPPRSHSTRLNSRRVLFIIRRIYLVGSSLIHTRSFNTVQRLLNVFACPSYQQRNCSLSNIYIDQNLEEIRILVENFISIILPSRDYWRTNGSRACILQLKPFQSFSRVQSLLFAGALFRIAFVPLFSITRASNFVAFPRQK